MNGKCDVQDLSLISTWAIKTFINRYNDVISTLPPPISTWNYTAIGEPIFRSVYSDGFADWSATCYHQRLSSGWMKQLNKGKGISAWSFDADKRDAEGQVNIEQYLIMRRKQELQHLLRRCLYLQRDFKRSLLQCPVTRNVSAMYQQL
jgi:hypothetical protein